MNFQNFCFVLYLVGANNVECFRLYNTVHIIVATPGRILDLASKKVADLSKCQTIIMDEADEQSWHSKCCSEYCYICYMY